MRDDRAGRLPASPTPASAPEHARPGHGYRRGAQGRERGLQGAAGAPGRSLHGVRMGVRARNSTLSARGQWIVARLIVTHGSLAVTGTRLALAVSKSQALARVSAGHSHDRVSHARTRAVQTGISVKLPHRITGNYGAITASHRVRAVTTAPRPPAPHAPHRTVHTRHNLTSTRDRPHRNWTEIAKLA